MQFDFKFFVDVVSVVANAFTVAASSIALYLFFTKRGEISKAFQLLINFSFQTTLSDLKVKVERLNEYKAGDPVEAAEIRNILNEIAGQVRGNVRLSKAAPDLADRVAKFAARKSLDEPAKRFVVAELREKFRTIEVANLDPHLRGDDE